VTFEINVPASCADIPGRTGLITTRVRGLGDMLRMSEGARTKLQRRARAALVVFLTFLATAGWSEQHQPDLTDMSIEDLMKLRVTSVSKTEESLSQAASAIFVITADAIRHSGATNIPDLLRMVPGMDVARINASTWAISARGFNARFSNELLVLIDGKSAYTPTFAGIYWDVLDLPLEDVQRIEVIRGPGATIWGANAVNGVINIVSRKSSETRGGLLVAGGGNIEQGFGTLQYGGSLGKGTDYRVFSKFINHIPFPGLNGGDGGDGWRMLRGGFRSDSALSAKTTLTLKGDIHSNREGSPLTELELTPVGSSQDVEWFANLSGGSLQAVWNYTSSPQSNTSIQAYYDTYKRSDQLHEDRKTIDLDFQNNFSGWRRQKIVWGSTYRYSTSRTNGSLGVSLDPPDLGMPLFGGFLQDEVAIAPDHFFLTGGVKLEHNYYTGFGVMPSARATWTPTPSHTLWAAVSKTERTPAEIDTALRANISEVPGPGGVPILFVLFGDPHVLNEGSIDYETGYRTMVGENLSIDLAAYYNNYSHQNTDEPSTPFFVATPTPHFVLPLLEENLIHGETHGMEVEANWKATDRWTLSSGYAFEQIHMHLAATSQDTDSVAESQGSTPVNAVQLRSHLALARGLAWDASGYFAGRLADPRESSYTRLDSQLSWQIGERINLSVVGQDLLKDRHQEFFDSTGSTGTTLVKRSGFANVTWRF